MMKRLLIIMLTMALGCCCIVNAGAEEGKFSQFLNAAGSFFSEAAESVSEIAEDAWGEASGKISDAWSDASDNIRDAWSEASESIRDALGDTSEKIRDVWGDASQWVEGVWNDSSEWAVEIWGDVSSWAQEAYQSASGGISDWWGETFDQVTASANDAWKWIQDESENLKTKYQDLVNRLKEAENATGTDAEDQVKDEFMALLKALQLDDADAEKVWETVEAYAREKGISVLSAAKMVLPYLMQLTINSENGSEGNIPAISVAQYLTAILEKTGISTDAGAEEYILQMTEVLENL